MTIPPAGKSRLFTRRRVAALLLLAAAGFLASCSGFHLLPRQEIDKFRQIDRQPVETMEVRGVIYVKVVNPAAKEDENAPRSIWIPENIYRRGGYQPAKTKLLAKLEEQVRKEKAAIAAAAGGQQATAGKSPAAAPPQAPLAPAAGLDEESLASAPAAVNRPPLLRRRAIIFPSYVTVTQPQVVSQLSLELEQQLPLQLLPPAVIPPREDSWQTNDLETLGKQLRRWLRQSPGLPAAQFILAVTTRKGTSRPCYRVTFFDAQTAAPVGSFSFCRQGRPRERFVPANPQPLVHLVMTSPWWCTVRPGPTEKTVYLTAGLKSGLAAGNRLQLRRPATRVIDPVKKIPLGFAFGAPLAEAVVVDFFGLDGAVANLDRPLARLPAGCLAILAPPAPLNLAAPSTAPGTSPTPAGMAPVPAPPAGTPPPAPGGGQTNNHL